MTAIFCVYLVLAYVLIRFSHQSTAQEIIFVYLVTATFDGFSQLTGQWIGRYALAPRLSPNKTLEGALGGLAAAMLTAFALSFLGNLSSLQALFVGAVLAIAGLTGDLAASYVKRLTGVKDFGRILPEHGGILDRFDSLLVAAPTFFIFTWSH
jgi:phosphatidate cytidylyltransferase